jgi:hypothetical protein
MIAKLAMLAVEDTKGGKHIAATSDHDTEPVRQAALAAMAAGSADIGGKQVPIVSGAIIHTWASPSIIWRFRCEPAAADKPKKK